jgi:hypothetical protein
MPHSVLFLEFSLFLFELLMKYQRVEKELGFFSLEKSETSLWHGRLNGCGQIHGSLVGPEESKVHSSLITSQIRTNAEECINFLGTT